MSTTTSTPSSTAQMSSGLMGQSSASIILQGYCNAVIQQQTIDVSGFPTLATYQTEIDNTLTSAQGHATNYLNVIQGQIITNITNMQNYYNLHQVVPTVCPPGSTVADWLNALGALQTQADTYASNSETISTTLGTLGVALDKDASNFTTVVTALNGAVNGDNGVLDGLRSSLSSINQKIDGDIAATVIAALVIVGGVFIEIAGVVTNVILPGVGTPAMIAGGVVIAVGVAGEVTAAVTLSGLLKDKANLISEESNLNAAVTAATGIEDVFNGLGTKVQAAVNAADAMQNAWKTLSTQLTTLAGDIKSGVTSTDTARGMFLGAAGIEVTDILTSITNIQTQMSGVKQATAPSGQSLSDYTLTVANQNQAA